MRRSTAFATLGLFSILTACSGAAKSTAGAASVSLNGSTYGVEKVAMTLETGEAGWFRIDGSAAGKPDEDCMPGLGSGLSLYGDLPSSIHGPLDLVGKRLRVEFTGDGDDANFCFAGMGGLAGAEEAWVTFNSVTGGVVTFSMEGTFKIYDENGEGPIATASAKGTAVAQIES